MFFESLMHCITDLIAVQNTNTINSPPEKAHCALNTTPISNISPVSINDMITVVTIVENEVENIYFTLFLLHLKNNLPNSTGIQTINIKANITTIIAMSITRNVFISSFSCFYLFRTLSYFVCSMHSIIFSATAYGSQDVPYPCASF